MNESIEVGMNAEKWREQVRSMISRAARAPSSHNTQPWLFRVTGPTIELFADRTRALPVNDPDDRELIISCGCALTNLRVAAAKDGFAASVHLLPDVEEPDLLARISFADSSKMENEEAQLADSITRRRTCRQPFPRRELQRSVLDRLFREGEGEGVHLYPLLTEEARQQVVALVAEGDRAQWSNPNWRRELAAWIHPRGRGDGLTVPAAAAPVARGVVRAFDMGGWVAKRDRKLADSSLLIVVLGTDGDETGDWLLAGQALERLLLAACRHGLQACYLNQPVQAASLRPQLRDLAGAGFPQICLALGYCDEEITPTPRRPLEDIVE